MADFAFNANKHLVGYCATLPAASDGFVFIPLASAGLAADSVLIDCDNLAAVLSNATEQTAMGRKVVTTSPAVNVDKTNDRVDIGAGYANLTWSAASGSATGKLLWCYDPDTTAGTDADLKLLGAFDFVTTPDGVATVAFAFNAAGLLRAA